MAALRDTIATLRKIQRKFGTIDAFVGKNDPDKIARQLSDSALSNCGKYGMYLPSST